MISITLPLWLSTTDDAADTAMDVLFGTDWPATHDYALADTDAVLVDGVADEALTADFGDWADAYDREEAASALAYRLEMRGL